MSPKDNLRQRQKVGTRSEMRLGYGSEFQLLRCLGHHRCEFDNHIRNALSLSMSAPIVWLDFPSDTSRCSLDGEWKSIECFRPYFSASYPQLNKEWRKYWPSVKSAMSWDAVFKVDNVWHFVEAKARAKEIETTGCGAKEKSRRIIEKALDKARDGLFKDSATKPWYGGEAEKAYQLANRLAFLWFCKTQSIPARIVYIEFLNGFVSPMSDSSVRSKAEWDSIWKSQWNRLGIPERLGESFISRICIDCKTIGCWNKRP